VDHEPEAIAMTDPELNDAIRFANSILDRNFGDPDDDVAILARQFLRCRERIAPPPDARPCEVCGGDGKRHLYPDFVAESDRTEACNLCKGTGRQPPDARPDVDDGGDVPECPPALTFDSVNEYVHTPGVHFEYLQWLCLSLVTALEAANKQISLCSMRGCSRCVMAREILRLAGPADANTHSGDGR
jgi:hypothetical protein